MPYTLLLADDSVTIQRVIELTFADEDVQVIAVSDGDQAIQCLEASPPDIVLADIGMPGKNGYEVAQYIRQSPRLSHIPVVLLTGAFEPVDQARAAEAGCDGVLAKPFEPQLVIGRVKELLARSHRIPETLAAELSPPAAAPADSWAPPLVDEPAAAPLELDAYFDRLDAAFSNLSSNTVQSPQKPAAPPSPGDDTAIDWFTTTASGATEPWDLPAPAAESGIAGSPGRDDPADLPLTDASPEPAAAPFPSPELATTEAPPFPVVELPEPFAAVDAVVGDAGAIATPAPAVAAEPLVAPEPVVPPEAVVPPTLSTPVAPAAAIAPPAPVAAIAPVAELPALADAFAALLAAEQGEPLPARAPSWAMPAAPAVSDDLVDDVTRRVFARLSDTSIRDTLADIVSQVAERLVREEIERIKASIK